MEPTTTHMKVIKCFFEYKRTRLTKIMKSIFMTRFHIKKLSSKLNEKGSVTHIQHINTISTPVSGVTEKSRLSLVSIKPSNVLPAMAAATGMVFKCHAYACGFIKLSHVQPI